MAQEKNRYLQKIGKEILDCLALYSDQCAEIDKNKKI